MLRHFRWLCALAMALCLMATPEVFAKKSSASKYSKQKTQARGDNKKTSKHSSRKEVQANNKKSSRRAPTVAKSRERAAPQAEPPQDKSRPTANPSETPLTPNPGRGNEANSLTDQNSQEINQPPAPRPVISSIPTERVAEIQTALIKHGYLDGEASGIYDDNTKAAMKKFQVANNLQASGLPSAHALKKLGVSKRGNSLNQVPIKTKSDVDKDTQQN